jgi:excisionase family DNA binding protein
MTINFDISDLTLLAAQIGEELRPLLIEILNKKNISPNHDDEIMTVDELTAYLKVDKRWIYAQTHLNCIPYFKAGNFLRFRKSLIDKHFSRCSVPAVSSARLPR